MEEGITQLLLQWSDGDRTALDRLLPMVYGELRRLAQSYLRRQRNNFSLQPTMLVHEAYLKLVNQEHVNWQNRAQFFGLSAKIMRDLMVDHARRTHAAKRGGDNYALSLSEADRLGQSRDLDLLALDEAMTELAKFKPRHCQIIELRFFGGLTIEETAEVLAISHATVERDWNFARTWLYRQLKSGGDSEQN
ncbi:MAG: sigma-70 family RNA polymerase sigma factor [Acidobacteriota bacterium]|nr:sigma-70 family RNA polymerase sigma factor [Acidobacteriota bacterium]